MNKRKATSSKKSRQEEILEGLSAGEYIMRFRPDPENLPKEGLVIPDRSEDGERPIPFIDYAVE